MDHQRLGAIARRYGIRLLLQFGSTVSGTSHGRSDVDVGVLLEQPTLSLHDYSELGHELQSLLPERQVDLVVLNRADPLLLKQVSEACVRLYGSERELQRFKLLAFKRYQDHRPYFEMERRYVARTLAHDFPES